jgi:signal transduction histidine kinase
MAVLAFFTWLPQFDQSASLPLFHFYIVTFTTFSAAVVSILLAASLGANAKPRHVLAAAAFAIMGSVFFSHGLATPNALIDHFHPAVQWSSWLTLFGGGLLFSIAALDSLKGMPRWLPVRGVINLATGLVLIYSAIAAFVPNVLTTIGSLVNPWHQYTIFIITLIFWAFATIRFLWLWRGSRSDVDAVLTFVAFWMIAATISMHRYPLWNYSWWLYHVALLVGFLITVTVLVQQYEQVRQFSLQRYFLGISLIITALLALLASALFTQFSYNTLVSEVTSSSIGVANNVANSLAHDLPDLVSPETVRSLSKQSGLHALIESKITDLQIVDALIYDDKGVAAYASEPEWIGVNVENRSDFEAALRGETVTEVRPPDDPPATYAPVEQVYIVETYAPIRPQGDAQAQPIGVLVLVEETPQLATTSLNARWTGLLTATVTMGLLFIALLLVVSRADRILTTRTSELATAYKNLREAESIRDDLTNMIVHDLRNPLTAISAGLDLVGRFNNETQSEARARIINNAQSASNRMMGMIEDLLTVSKIDAGQFNLQPQTTNLYELLSAATNTFAPQAAADQKMISLQCPVNLMVSLDAPLIRRVVENLIGNALKYTETGTGQIQVLVTSDDQRVTITVRDNGEGIPDAHKQRIFEKFVQLSNDAQQRKGAGLGLAFCKLVVQQHGGDIRVENAPQHGSDFIFRLPL